MMDDLTANWRCPHCNCRSFSFCAEPQPNGTYAPGKVKRCHECKSLDYHLVIRELEAQLATARAETWEAAAGCAWDIAVMMELHAALGTTTKSKAEDIAAALRAKAKEVRG